MAQPIKSTPSMSARIAALKGKSKRSGSAGEIVDTHGVFSVVRYSKKTKGGDVKAGEYYHTLSIERDNGVITGFKYTPIVEAGTAVLEHPEDFLSACESLALLD